MSKYGNKLPIYPGGGNLLLGEREREAAFGFADLLSLSVCQSVSIPLSQSVSLSLPSAVKLARLERARARLEGRRGVRNEHF